MSFKAFSSGFFFLALTFVFSSCNLDQVNKYYPNYLTAKSENLFKKGWIPENIAFESMSEIYLYTNLDLNTCFFTFTLSEQDLDRITQILARSEREFQAPARVKISQMYVDAIESLDKYYHINPINQDTVFLSVNYKTKKVYGWIN